MSETTITLPPLQCASELSELIQLCKASIDIEVNQHRDYYEPVMEYLKDSIRIHQLGFM